MMVPLIGSSIIALAIILERAIQLRQKKVLDPQVVRMLASIKELKDIDATHVLCNQSNGTFTNLIKVGLENRELPNECIGNHRRCSSFDGSAWYRYWYDQSI
jgi:biopolymer transport protein ExbB